MFDKKGRRFHCLLFYKKYFKISRPKLKSFLHSKVMFCSWPIILVVTVCVACIIYLRNRAPSESKKLKKLKGKVVLITGASSGLGKACCFAFRRYGCKVILCSRSVEELKTVQKSLEESFPLSRDDAHLASIVHRLDVSDLDNVANNIREIAAQCDNRIDILVNNAGIGNKEAALKTNLDVYRRVFDVNIFGPVAVTKAVLPFMVSQGSGHVVGIGSIQNTVAIPFRSAYSASKHGVQGFYDSLRPEVKQYNIKVTCVNPGYINTNISQNALKGDGSAYSQPANEYITGMKPEYVADWVVNAVVKGWSEVVVAPLYHRMAPSIRFLFPDLAEILIRRQFGL